MRSIALAIVIINFFSCSNYSGIVYEGKKFNDIVLNESTMLDVVEIYGKPKRIMNWDGNEENFYRNKLSFTYDKSDNHKKINYITFFEKFKGKTTKGLLLDKTLILDSVLKYYPEGNWEISYDSLELLYWKSNIYFVLDLDQKEFKKWNSHDNLASFLKKNHKSKKIKEIIIY